MSFIIIKTVKGETVCLNCGKILFFCESKKGSTVVMEDGIPFEMNVPLQCFFEELNRGTLPSKAFEKQ